MKSRTAALMTLVFCIVMAVGFSSLVIARQSDSNAARESPGGKIEGTWRVQVTQRNCQTGAELRTFPAMLTFAQGGTLTGTTTAFPVSLRSPDHGIWSHNGGSTYRAVSEAFQFNPAGAWVATQRITQSIELAANSNTFNSNAAVEFFDALGNSTGTGCATAVATRME